jgi:hypothetical protein
LVEGASLNMAGVKNLKCLPPLTSGM